ncbi:M15 family metallopeptidase [Psychroflexus lacisalsi]|jgi:LAS superfamily LD-carboxypeptidase LdcB|uniref:D-alanyl-D-alanine carboxypeptidase-like core domain-containing protein n=1 Tax=Psychroflexus lacisalsi TaxID=503928 RepID=A0ABN1K6I1_9FLAO|nr:M15 family metallopeptidase [Psychroflexus lacisalsi]MBZ9619283.1 M15 family metallopeptidase [Psychroflexus lacisalsi]
MNRKKFIKSSVLVAVGTHFSLNSKLVGLLELENIKTENLLGISQSHLKSDTILLEEDTYEAFLKMKSKALEDGIDLKIASGYRSFKHQKAIWERKFNQLIKTNNSTKAISQIITYSSIPGTSRHHWGTDVDLIDGSVNLPDGDLLLEQNYHGYAPFSKMRSWMEDHANKFGFELVYTQNKNRSGFNYEPWHYSFAPKSRSFLKFQLRENYKRAWDNLEFDGKSEMTKKFMDTYFNNYGAGINPSLMPS